MAVPVFKTELRGVMLRGWFDSIPSPPLPSDWHGQNNSGSIVRNITHTVEERHERDQDMETINVKDLPEPVARGLEAVAEMARKLAGTRANGHERIQLGVRAGTVYGTLSRKELYKEDDN